VAVEVLERSAQLGASACSWFAGGMLAPWCELESCDPLNRASRCGEYPWWRERFAGTVMNGTLVVAQGRELRRMSRSSPARTRHCEALASDVIAGPRA